MSQVGTDFTIMTPILSKRTRKVNNLVYILINDMVILNQVM